MTDQTSITLPDEIQWMPYILRLTAFPSPLAQFDSSNWWANIVGELPESQDRKPKIGKVTEIGPFDGSNLILDVQPDRIDWRLTSLSEVNRPLPLSKEELVPLQPILNRYIQIANEWFRVAPPLIRLAFGARLGIPVDNKIDGSHILSSYLPFMDMDFANSSDFLYQINRSRTSTVVPELRLNRLTKWSVLSATTGSFVMRDQQPVSTSTTQNFYSCHLELDINTSAENTDEYQPEHLSPLFDELVQIGLEIAQRGDIP